MTVAIRGDDESEIDAGWREGVTRRIVLRTPHFLAALAAVGASDCVTTLSATLARRFAKPSVWRSSNRPSPTSR